MKALLIGTLFFTSFGVLASDLIQTNKSGEECTVHSTTNGIQSTTVELYNQGGQFNGDIVTYASAPRIAKTNIDGLDIIIERESPIGGHETLTLSVESEGKEVGFSYSSVAPENSIFNLQTMTKVQGNYLRVECE